MRASGIQLLLVILGLVLSAALMSSPLELWSAALSLLTLMVTLIAFSTWVHSRAVRSRSILLNGAAVLLAAALWLEFILTAVESPLRWLLAIALAWMMAPFAAFGLAFLVERIFMGSHRSG